MFVPPLRPPSGVRRPGAVPWLLLAAVACLVAALLLGEGADVVALGTGLAVLAAGAVIMARASWAAATPVPEPDAEPTAADPPAVDLEAHLRQLREAYGRTVPRPRPARGSPRVVARGKGCGGGTVVRATGPRREETAMSSTALTADSFAETVRADGIVLVDWWAAWCGPCRAFAPVFEAASEKHTDIVFAKVDTEAEDALSSAAGIRSIPTLMAFRDGILVFSNPGSLPAETLEQVIAGVRSLDMDAVREQLAAQDAAAAAQDGRTA